MKFSIFFAFTLVLIANVTFADTLIHGTVKLQGGLDKVQISIIDTTTGKIKESKKCGSLDVYNFYQPQGTYLLSVKFGQHVKTKRIVLIKRTIVLNVFASFLDNKYEVSFSRSASN